LPPLLPLEALMQIIGRQARQARRDLGQPERSAITGLAQVRPEDRDRLVRDRAVSRQRKASAGGKLAG